jgi:hypothetical protein
LISSAAYLQETFCMQSSIESEIQARVQAFTSELTELIRASAMELVSEALGGTAASGRGRPRANGARTTTARGPGRPKGAKRDPEDLAALTDKLGAYIAKNPGLRIEEIGKALGTPTKDLALPVKKLIATKRISTKGQKRSTKYFPK